MTHVHYKFSSKLSYDTVVFDGPHITLRDLKRQIMGREKLRAGDCDLQITNAQSKEEYTDDEGLIPKGSSVIVRRIPVSGGKSSSNSKTNNIASSAVQFHHSFGTIRAMDDQSSSKAFPFFAKMANLAEADVSEEDKIKVMLNQSSYDSMNYNKKFGTVLPANYTCYRCGNTGHHIRNCPTSGQDKNFEAPLRIKKSTGIPRSFMVEVDDPNTKGAMLTNSGRYAIPAIDAAAYAIGKKEKPPFIPQENTKSETEEDPIPDELLCLICHDLLSDAVVIPCCGNSYCDDCIRTTLLDSDEHVCPTCSQSDVSPDTLIANKFLRQAVNNFKKERGYTKNLKKMCGFSQSQNLTTRPSPVPTPPLITGQSQPQKPHQPPYSQQVNQDSLQYHTNVADTLPVSGAPPAATGNTSAHSTPGTPIHPEQICQEIREREAEEKTQDDAVEAVAAPSVLVSNKEPTAAPSQLIPVVNHAIVAEQPQTVINMNQPQSFSALCATPSPCGPPNSWDSSSSSSGHSTRPWNESHQLTSSSSSSYSATTPPLFPSPLFLSTHPSQRSYPPRLQPTTPVWQVPSSQGTPIPSLCASTSTSSIPSLIPEEWYRHQRRKNERSPHKGSTYKRSSYSSKSKSSKSKSSRSYSNSSSRSRSRSRSRSQGRSRHLSPYFRHRDCHTRSHPSSSYGYKRSPSPTPSSSSSPRRGYYSRSKSPSDLHRKRHHSRHQNKKSSSSGYNSRRRGEHLERETRGSEAGLASQLYAQHLNQTASVDLDRERYLQWKKEYKEWCEKYFSSYVGHFHQLPLPLLSLPPPPPPPQWVDSGGIKNHSHANSHSHYQAQGRCATQMDGHSPTSSSDSQSPPSQSSSDSHCTPSQSFSDSGSSPSHTSNDSCSPPSQSSTEGHSTPSEDRTQLSAYQQKYNHLQKILSKSIEEVKQHKRSKGNKEVSVKHDQKRRKRHEDARGELSSSPAVAGLTNDRRSDVRQRNSGCKDGTSKLDEATTSDTLKSIQPSLKSNKYLNKHCERESREQWKAKGEKGWRRGKHSDSKKDVERPHKVKPSKESDRVDTGRYRNPAGRKPADITSEKNRKRKREELESNETQRKSESPNPFDRKKQKKETSEVKTQSPTERDIWEEGIKVKPQKKISIKINLDGKTKKNDQELSCSQNIAGKIKEENEKNNSGEDNFNKDPEAKLKPHMEFSRGKEGACEETIKQGEDEASKMWEKGTFREVGKSEKNTVEEEETGEKRKKAEDEDFDLWHCALSGVVEELDSKKLWEEKNVKKGSKGEEVTRVERRNMTVKEDGEERNESRGQEMEESVQHSQKTETDGKSTCDKNREIPLELKTKRPEELMEGLKRTINKEKDIMRTEEEMSRHKSHHDSTNTAVDSASHYEDHQELRTVVKTLEDYTQDRATGREGEHVLIKVPFPKWDKASEGEEQDKTELTAQDALVCVHPQFMVPTNQEKEGENEQNRWKSEDRERDRDTRMQRDSSLPGINRMVAPSSGKHRNDSTFSTDREWERRMELDRCSNRDRGRERPRDREKETKRSKEKRTDEERERKWGSERGHSSTISVHKRNHSSCGPFSSSTSHETERRDWQPGSDFNGKPSDSERKERSSVSTAVELPDKNAYKIGDSKSKDKTRSHGYSHHRDPSHNNRHHDRPVGTYHSPASFSQAQIEVSDTFLSGSFGSKSRMSSPSWELMQNRIRKERKEEKGEWKQNMVDKVIRQSRRDRATREMEADREEGGRWEDEANKLVEENKWEERRGLDGVERSSSSSAILENNEDDRRKGRKKHKKYRKEKRQAVLEETELKERKSKKNVERREEESGGEVDDSRKEEDHTRLCSVTLS